MITLLLKQFSTPTAFQMIFVPECDYYVKVEYQIYIKMMLNYVVHNSEGL